MLRNLVYSTIRPASTTLDCFKKEFSERIQCYLNDARLDCSPSHCHQPSPGHKSAAGRGQRPSHSHDVKMINDGLRRTIKIIENVRRITNMGIPKITGARIPSIFKLNANDIS